MKQLEQRMNDLSKSPCEVRIHENTTTYLRTERKSGKLHLHMHRFFTEAPTPVLQAVLRFATKRKDRDALRMIRQMADLYFSENRAEPVELKKTGVNYNLQTLLKKVRAKYFALDYNPSIGWSERSPRGNFCSITYGSYDRHRHQIRMNPILDHEAVPSYFIEFIVYHEMLHGVCLPQIDRLGRTWVHTKEFREKEKQFAQFAEAKEWEKKSLAFFKGLRKKNGRT